jgi:hypothetical protein
MNREIRTRLEDELMQDGLIDNRNYYRLKLSKDKLMINGKRQEKELVRKYVELYEAISGMIFKDGTQIELHRDTREKN